MWITVTVPASAAQAPQVEESLWALGALSVTIEPRDTPDLFEPPPGATPLWEQVAMTALFPADADPGRLAATLEARGLTPSAGTLADRVWEREWLQYFKPVQFGERLWICPTGYTVEAGDAAVLRLDPGLAFGTGTHATTSLCLDWIAANAFRNRSVIDYGCGSGILAIAAALLGAVDVTGVDIDPQALRATADNAARNDVVVRCIGVDGQQTGTTADVVFANILAGPLVALAEPLSAMVAPAGTLVLSGIRTDQRDEVVGAYAGRLCLDEVATRDGWLRIVMSQRSG